MDSNPNQSENNTKTKELPVMGTPDQPESAAVQSAAAPARQKFGKRSERRRQSVNTEQPERELTFASEADTDTKTENIPVQQPVLKRTQNTPKASLNAEPVTIEEEEVEQATFVQPVAANAIKQPKVTTSEEPADEREEELFNDFKEPNIQEITQEVLREDEQIDPGASLVDDYDYDLYEDKRRFLLSDYKRIEEYLSRQSRQGYHYVRHEGKHYYFHHGFPRDYYYQMLYFVNEPPESQFANWQEDGWTLISRTPGKKKKEAGWFIMRNEQARGAFKKEIENEEEKYRFFRSYSNSCRSTMFLLFICMAICGVMGFLQYYFQGYPMGIAFCVIIFALALWVFLMYGRMLRKSNKQIRLLKAKIRLQDSNAQPDIDDLEENQDELDEDWDQVENPKNRRSRSGK